MLPLDSPVQASDRVIVAIADDGQREAVAEAVARQKRFDVHRVGDWNALRRLLQEERFEVVLIGQRIGAMSAIEAIQWVRDGCDDPPALVMVGPGSAAAAIKAFRCGFADYLCEDALRVPEIRAAVTRAAGAVRVARAQSARLEYLEKLSPKDAVTGLPSRLHLEQQIERLVRVAERHGSQFALIGVHVRDLDPIYATYGSKVGDQVLRAFAARLREASRNSDMLGQIEADTFVCLIDREVSAEGILAAGARLAEAAQFHLDLDRVGISLAADIRSALFPADGRTAAQLLARVTRTKAAARATAGTTVPHPGATQAEALGPGRVARESDRREAHRQRVLKRGVLILNDGFSTIDCVIRDISPTGARVAVDGHFTAPRFVELLMIDKNEKWRAETRWQNGSHLGLQFVNG